MVKKSILWLVLLSALLVLSACSSGNNGKTEGGSSTSNGNSGETQTPPASTKAEEVEFWYAIAGANGEVVAGLVDEYNSSQDKYFVNATFIPNAQRMEQLSIAIASGETPDLYTAGPPDVASLAASERLLSIDKLAENHDVKIERDRFFNAMQDIVVKEGELYGVPASVGVTALYYNEDLFNEHGLDGAPETWEQLVEYGKAISDPANDQWGLLLPTQENGYTARMWATFLQQAGGDLLNEEATEAIFHEETGIKALQFWVDLFHEHEIAPLKQLDENTTTQTFAAGKVGMFIGYPLWTVQSADFPFTTKTARAPRDVQGASAVGGWYLTVPSQGKNPDGAYDFLAWLIQPDNAVKWNLGMGNLPTQQEAIDTAAYQQYLEENPLVRPFNDSLELDAVAPPNTGKFNQILDPIAKAVTQAIYQQKTPQEALEDAAAEVNRILSEQ